MDRCAIKNYANSIHWLKNIYIGLLRVSQSEPGRTVGGMQHKYSHMPVGGARQRNLLTDMQTINNR